jgi:uncharacterized membrane protein YkoI
MKRIIATSFALAAACAAVGDANQPQCTAKCCKAAVRSAALPPNNGFIGREAAIKAALAHAKLRECDVCKLKCELDREDGVMVYEVEFKKDGFEYDYDIDAKTGKVLKAKKERD